MASKDEIMIQVQGLKKQYRIGQIGGGTLRGDLQSWWARKRGKEDPNTLVGTDQRLIGQTFMALNGLDFTIRKGEAVGIIGSNGAGKSTLLKILTHVTAPTEGTVDMYGRVASMLEVGTGFHPEMTGRENVYLNGAILGMSKAEIDAKMEDIIEFSEVRDFIDTPVKRYSSGMYVKLAFSVAAHLDSEIMIMDEVLAVGDMKFQQKCLNKMKEAATQEGRTVLYVSHNMSTIRQLCDRCIVLNQGKIVFSGDVEKGIEVYAGVSKETFPAKYNLEKTPRPPYGHGKMLLIESLEFLGKVQACFTRNEKMRFRLTFLAKSNLENLRIYFVLRTYSDKIVGMAQKYEPFVHKVEAGTRHTYDFEFDFSNICAGQYYFRPDIFSCDEAGNHMSYDQPVQNICFQIIENQTRGLTWKAANYGEVYLNEIRCMETVERNQQ